MGGTAISIASIDAGPSAGTCNVLSVLRPLSFFGCSLVMVAELDGNVSPLGAMSTEPRRAESAPVWIDRSINNKAK